MRYINYQIIIFTMIVNLSYSSIYDLVVLNSATALCLDGSPASYYLSRDGN